MKKIYSAIFDNPWMVIAFVFLSRIIHNIFMYSISGEIFSPHVSKFFNFVLGYELLYFGVLIFVFFGIFLFSGFVGRILEFDCNENRKSYISLILSILCFLLFFSDILIPFIGYQYSLFFSNLVGTDELYRILLANYKVALYIQSEVIEEYLTPYSLSFVTIYVTRVFKISQRMRYASYFLVASLILPPLGINFVNEDSLISEVLLYYGYFCYQASFPLIMSLVYYLSNRESYEIAK